MSDSLEIRLQAARDRVNEQGRHLHTIAEMAQSEFQESLPLDYLLVFYEDTTKFRARIFFKTEEYVHSPEGQAAGAQIAERIGMLLEQFGRGDRKTNEVIIDCDSTERTEGRYWNS